MSKKTELSIYDWSLCINKPVLMPNGRVAKVIGVEAPLWIHASNEEGSVKFKYCKPLRRKLSQLTLAERVGAAERFDFPNTDRLTDNDDFFDELMDYAGPTYATLWLLEKGIDVLDWIPQGKAIAWDKEIHGSWV